MPFANLLFLDFLTPPLPFSEDDDTDVFLALGLLLNAGDDGRMKGLGFGDRGDCAGPGGAGAGADVF